MRESDQAVGFRELPAVLEALEDLSTTPDLVVCDGYGLAHPHRAGLAVHLGVVTGFLCFGVAKSPFTFDYFEPAARRGSWELLRDKEGEIVGRAVRTQDGIEPVFVSVGHRILLENATAHTLALPLAIDCRNPLALPTSSAGRHWHKREGVREP